MSESNSLVTAAQKMLLERVQLLYAHAPKAVPFNLINGGILSIVLWPVIDHFLLLIWFGTLALITVARAIAIAHQQRGGRLIRNYARALNHFTIGTLLTGATWGGGYFMLTGVPETYRILYLLVLGGMASGAFTSMAASTQAYAAFVLPMIPPAALSMLLTGGDVQTAAGVMMMLFVVVVITNHRLSSDQLLDGIRLKHRNDDLVNELSSSNEQLKRSNEKLRRVKDDLRVISLTDELTGLSNRRHFAQMFNRLWKQSARNQQSLCCLMIDIDHFKAYNDHYGHQQGDECLRQVAQILKRSAQRPQDLLARYGGEEFVAILPDTNLSGAVLVAERILSEVHRAQLPHHGTSSGQLSLSIGLASCKDTVQCQAEDLVKSADKALYNAKHDGRDRLSISADALAH